MEKNDSGNHEIGSFTIERHGKLPYQEKVLDLWQDRESLENPDDETVAYTRVDSDAIEALAALGEAPYISAIPDAIEYKLTDYDESEPIDNPLRDLDSPTGSTRFFSIMKKFAKLGLDLHKEFTQDDQATMVRALEDLENDSLVHNGYSEIIERLISMAENYGVSRKEVEKILKSSSKARGVLVGLSQEFLDDAGEDVWPTYYGQYSEHNNPYVYGKLPNGLKIDYITKLVPLEEDAEKALQDLQDHVDKVREIEEVHGAAKIVERRVQSVIGIDNVDDKDTEE